MGQWIGRLVSIAPRNAVLGTKIEPGALYVIAGRPGMGKSALGLQMALHAAMSGKGVGYISLEMQASQLGRRALAIVSGTPQFVLKKGSWDNADAERIVLARKQLRNVPLTIEDEGGMTTQAIAVRARAMRRRHGLAALFVDHMHIVATPRLACPS